MSRAKSSVGEGRAFSDLESGSMSMISVVKASDGFVLIAIANGNGAKTITLDAGTALGLATAIEEASTR